MKKWLIVLLLLLLSTPSALAAQPVPGLDELWEQAEDYGVTEDSTLHDGLSNLFSDALYEGRRLLKGSLSTGWKLLAVVLLCSVAEGTSPGGQKGIQAVELTGAMAITALTMTDVAAMMGLGRETIGRMNLFSGVLIPVMATLSAATGGITSAAVRQGATVLFSKLLLVAMDNLLLPLVYAYVAVNCAHGAVGNPGLQKLAGVLKSTATFLLTALLLAFVGYLTASGAVAGSVDASAVKAARLAISRTIPVVGSILADASESVLVGAGILRSSVGVAGMLVVLAICLTPFLQLAFQYLVYKGVAALCGTIAQPRLSQLIDALGSAFGLILGMTGAGALVLLMSLVSAIKAVIP